MDDREMGKGKGEMMIQVQRNRVYKRVGEIPDFLKKSGIWTHKIDKESP